MGSAGDGFGFFPSQGSNKHLFEDRAVLTQDIDLNVFMNTLVPEKKNLVAVPEAEGFTWIKLSKNEVRSLGNTQEILKHWFRDNSAAYFMARNQWLKTKLKKMAAK